MRLMLMRIVVMCAVSLSALVAAGCSGSREPRDGDSPGATTVVVSFYPLAWLAESMAGDNVSVRNLTPAGAEPHDLELTPRDVADLQAADIVIYLGRGFQPVLEDALEHSDATKIDVLDTPSLSLLKPVAGDEEELAIDPHVWLDPDRFSDVAGYVADEAGWDAGAAQEELSVLDAEIDAGLGQCEHRDLFTSHAAFGYLADRYDLEQVAITGLSPEAEPLPQDLERVAEQAEEAGATTIYFETLVSPQLSEQVADEVGAATAVLDPLEGIDEERLDDGVEYPDIMRENLGALRSGLGCAPS